MNKRKAPLYMGGGGVSESKLDLQKFAEVSNPYTDDLEEDLEISSLIEKQRTLVDLSRYAGDNIANYETITKLPQKNIEYLSSGLSASDCDFMFSNCIKLVSIPWNEFNIDTSQCTSMSGMFYTCRALTSLNLSSFDTSKVTMMNGMFYYCTALASLDLSNFDTSKATAIYQMFWYCESLTSLDLSNFDTSKVTSMNSMFNSCGSLQEIICPNGFDMSSCTDVRYMFSNCNSYTGEPLHFKNVPRNLDFSSIGGAEGKHYVIDSYKD